jgi:hypothetical protein
MKKRAHLLVITSLFFFQAYSQLSPIDVAESTLKVNAFGEEAFYYGFAEGDQLIFNFEEVKGKELKELEIIELPSSSKFMDYKTAKIENKIIRINKTAIYKFRFANSAMAGRICKFKIQRQPANESSINFDPAVSWRTIYDTVTRTVQEKYLMSSIYKPVSLIPTSSSYINGGRVAAFGMGKSRILFPVVLPKNTVEWFYQFSSFRDEESANRAKSSMNLTGQLMQLINPGKWVSIGVELLKIPPGADYCDIYLLDYPNSILFEDKKEYSYYPLGTRKNFTSGVVKLPPSNLSNLFLGIKNPDAGVGIHVTLEVTAITLEEEWGSRDVIKYDISSRQEAYLHQ